MRFQACILFSSMLFIGTSILFTGCARRAVELPPKSPRPVKTITLQRSTPANASNLSGSVKSWKTEQIGFEVAGRLLWVLEPGQNIVSEIRDEENNIIRRGTALAQIDPSRYQVAVESAQASLDVAMLDQEIATIRFNEGIPQEIKSAEADLQLAQDDLARLKPLRAQGAVSQAEYDSTDTRVKTQQARLENLKSNLKQAQIELKAAEARVKSAQQSLNDANRDLANTTLYASYRGQISAVDVVPGSVVSAGSPILTLQMMNPINVEIEVSAELSRILQQRRQLGISYKLQDGKVVNKKAMVYLVDPSADSSTRTFTVSSLVRNDQYRPPLPASHAGQKVARSQKMWPLNAGEILENLTGVFLVEQDAIETDSQGDYVWLISGFKLGDSMPEVVSVEKRRVTTGDFAVPFLGNWNFKQVTFADPSIDSEGLIAGKLEFPDNPREEWDGKSLYLDSGDQWTLRPGDIVNVIVDPAQSEPSYFVPVGAIYEEGSRAYVFAVEGGVAKRIEVLATFPQQLDTESKVHIENVQPDELVDGMQIVTSGVHYLNDGDKVVTVQNGDDTGEQQ